MSASALLFWLSQPPFDCWWLGPVVLVPWLCTLSRVSPLRCGAEGLLFGTLGGALVAGWLGPGLRDMGASFAAAALGAVGVPLVVAGLAWGILGVSLGTILRRAPTLFVVLASLAAGGIDFVRSHAGFGVPWGLLGHSQWSAPGFAQLAALGGVPLVSAVLMACNAALVRLWWAPRVPARRWQAGAALLTCLALWAGGVPLVELARGDAAAGPEHEMLVVQPNLPAGERWNPQLQASNLGVVRRLTDEALAEGGRQPTAVLWPESTLTHPIERMDAVRADLLAWVRERRVQLIIGLARASAPERADRYRNSAVWITPEGEIAAAVDKTVAVPLVESEDGFGLPEPLWSWLGVPRQGVLTEPGAAERPLTGPIEAAVTLCYEVIFPGLVAARRSADTTLLLNLANDSWFGTDTVSRQQIAYGVFRAIEQRLWLVRAAHGGESVVIDPLGRIVASLPHGTSGVLWTSVRRESPPSPAERLAIAGLGFGPALLVLAIGRVLGRRRSG